MPPRHVVIADPDSKRWRDYQRELHAFWRERGEAAEVAVVSWRELVLQQGDLDHLAAFDSPAAVRLESYGRDFEVAKMLLHIGARSSPDDRDSDWLGLAPRKGWLARPGLQERGFAHVLRGLKQAFDQRPHLRISACPLAVLAMFDKTATSRRLVAAGLATPPTLPPPASPLELLDELRQSRWRTAYVKLNASAAAMGIVVVHPLDPVPWGVSSMVRIDGEWHNTRRLQRLEGDELHAALAFLLREGCFIQQGVPLARVDGHHFDVRVVVLNGEPAFTVFRLSTGPMTNLHLGGRRGDHDRCRSAIPTRHWLDALDLCAEAARLVRSDVVGVDVVFDRDSLRPSLLELNAFGDFFPGLVDAQGRSIHRREIETLAGGD